MGFPTTAVYSAASYNVNVFLFDGDSMNRGTTAGTEYSIHTLLSARSRFAGKGQFFNVAVGGTSVAQQVAAFDQTKLYRAPLGHGFLFHWGGTAGLTETTFNDMEAYWTLARNDGWKVVANLLQPKAGESGATLALREATNASILASTKWDYLLNVASVIPDPADTAIYSDGVHLTALGYETVADYINSVIAIPVL